MRVQLSAGMHAPHSKFVEVSGRVNPDGKSISAVRARERACASRRAARRAAPSPAPRPLAHSLVYPALPSLQSEVSELGEAFDMDAYNELITLAPGFANMF